MADRSNTDAANAEAQTQAEAAANGKGRPTPSRKEREAARKQPLVPSDRKAAAAADRQRQASERQKARIGMQNGDDRYLTARDKGPQRRYARDFVDARWSLGEFLIPVVVVLLIVTFIPAIAGGALIAVWAFFALTIIDCIVMGFQLKKRLDAAYGSMDSGIRWYASMRALQLRMIRLPKPQVKRGEYPTA